MKTKGGNVFFIIIILLLFFFFYYYSSSCFRLLHLFQSDTDDFYLVIYHKWPYLFWKKPTKKKNKIHTKGLLVTDTVKGLIGLLTSMKF